MARMSWAIGDRLNELCSDLIGRSSSREPARPSPARRLDKWGPSRLVRHGLCPEVPVVRVMHGQGLPWADRRAATLRAQLSALTEVFNQSLLDRACIDGLESQGVLIQRPRN
jgi:hypothetical protein